ncbi:MAG: hypothetical protein AAF432_07830 [Planctomycetota bacterium]
MRPIALALVPVACLTLLSSTPLLAAQPDANPAPMTLNDEALLIQSVEAASQQYEQNLNRMAELRAFAVRNDLTNRIEEIDAMFDRMEREHLERMSDARAQLSSEGRALLHDLWQVRATRMESRRDAFQQRQQTRHNARQTQRDQRQRTHAARADVRQNNRSTRQADRAASTGERFTIVTGQRTKIHTNHAVTAGDRNELRDERRDVQKKNVATRAGERNELRDERRDVQKKNVATRAGERNELRDERRDVQKKNVAKRAENRQQVHDARRSTPRAVTAQNFDAELRRLRESMGGSR